MTRRVIDCYICTNILIGAENRIAASRWPPPTRTGAIAMVSRGIPAGSGERFHPT